MLQAGMIWHASWHAVLSEHTARRSCCFLRGSSNGNVSSHSIEDTHTLKLSRAAEGWAHMPLPSHEIGGGGGLHGVSHKQSRELEVRSPPEAEVSTEAAGSLQNRVMFHLTSLTATKHLRLINFKKKRMIWTPRLGVSIHAHLTPLFLVL